MSAAAPAPASPPLPDSPPRPAPPVAFWPVFGWLALQMLTLLAAAFRVPLSAQFPAPAERLAVYEMLVVQIAGSALLFPLLFPTFATALLIAGSAVMMLQLAAVLAGQSDARLITLTCAYVTAWLTGLGVWSYALGSPRVRLYGVAGASLLAIGGTVVAYVGREFGAPAEAFDWSQHAHLGPVMGAMALLQTTRQTGTMWVFLGSFLLAGLAAAMLTRFRPREPSATP